MRIILSGEGVAIRDLLSNPLLRRATINVLSKDGKFLDELSDDFDVKTFIGSPISEGDLRSAGVKAGTLYAALGSDNTSNILSAALAKKIGAISVIATTKGMASLKDIQSLEKAFDIDFLFDLDYEEACEISRRVSFPKIFASQKFITGNAVINEIEVPAKSPLMQKPLKELRLLNALPNLRVAAVKRRGSVIIPRGSTLLEEGDHLLVVAEEKSMMTFLKKARLIKAASRKALLIGGGKVAGITGDRLTREGVKVTVLEENSLRCETLLQEHPSFEVLHGSGSDMALLHSLSIRKFGSVIALTGKEETNLAIALYAKSQSVKKVIGEIEEPSFASIMERNEVDDAVSSRRIAVNEIANRLAGCLNKDATNRKNSSLKALYPLFGGNIWALLFSLPKAFPLYGVPLMDSRFKIRDDVIIGGILRADQLEVPSGSSSFREGDEAIIITSNSNLINFGEIFHS